MKIWEEKIENLKDNATGQIKKISSRLNYFQRKMCIRYINEVFMLASYAIFATIFSYWSIYI